MPQEQKREASQKMEAALEQLREIEEASRGSIVYIRGRATVLAKPGTNLFSRLVRCPCYMVVFLRCPHTALDSLCNCAVLFTK